MGRRYTAAALSVILAVSLCGCMGYGMSGSGATVISQPSIAEPEPVQPRGALRIAIVTSPAGVDDGGLNAQVNRGILSFIESVPASTVTAVRERDTDYALRAASAVASDYDVIVLPGLHFAGIAKEAKANPQCLFLLVGAAPRKTTRENVRALLFREQESGFLAGAAAAMETQTGKVAFVGGLASNANRNRQMGFEAGVFYMNSRFGTSARVVALPEYAAQGADGSALPGNYVVGLADAAGAKAVARALIDDGCDILFDCSDGSGGVIAAAKESDSVRVIASGGDRFDEGARESGDNVVLLSVYDDVAGGVSQTLQTISDGLFRPGVAELGADSGVTQYVELEGRHQLSGQTVEELGLIYEQISMGEIVPPGGTNGYTAEEFPGLEDSTKWYSWY